MLSRQHLLHEGRLVPAAIVYAHDRDLEELGRVLPGGASRWLMWWVIRASTGSRPTGPGGIPTGVRWESRTEQRLVVVTSTWGPASTFGRLDSLLPQLLSQLPRDLYRVAMLVHPNVFPGSRLAGATDRG